MLSIPLKPKIRLSKINFRNTTLACVLADSLLVIGNAPSHPVHVNNDKMIVANNQAHNNVIRERSDVHDIHGQHSGAPYIVTNGVRCTRYPPMSPAAGRFASEGTTPVTTANCLPSQLNSTRRST